MLQAVKRKKCVKGENPVMDIKVRILGLLPIIVLVTNREKKEDIINA